MPADLFGERFLSLRKPAWHRLGTIVQDPVGAAAGLDLIGDYRVEREPVFRRREDGTFEALPYKALVRHATEDADTEVFNVVSEDYGLIGPRDFCRLWDEHVAQPVETLGALRQGRQLFISTKLPSFTVAGDDVDNYLISLNGMDGIRCAKVFLSPVRVVCSNTLRMAEDVASESYPIHHRGNVRLQLGAWMSHLVERYIAESTTVKDVFEAMARRPIDKNEMKFVIELAYPLPTKPSADLPKAIREQRLVKYEKVKREMERHRTGATALYLGDGVGMETPAAKGTLWGVYNAVCECEDYRRGQEEASAANALDGNRALAKQRAFSAAVEILKN